MFQKITEGEIRFSRTTEDGQMSRKQLKVRSFVPETNEGEITSTENN